MMIDEIINRIFQQNILELKFSAFSDAFFKRTTRASPLPCVFHQTNDQGTSNNIAITYANSKLFSRKLIFSV